MGYRQTKVRNYSDKELLARCYEVGLSPADIYKKEFLVLVSSNEDTPNIFDDKGYRFNENNVCDLVFTLTTNGGRNALKGGFKKYNKNGMAVIKTDQVMLDAFSYGYHNSKMPSLKQVKDIYYHRDGNLDDKTDEEGVVYRDNYSTNFHANSYNMLSKVMRWFINGWSYGCMVCNDIPKYSEMMKRFKKLKKTGKQKYVTIILLKEF